MDETAAVLDALPDATLVVDTNGTVALANRRAESLLGYGPNELDGRPIGDVLDAVDGDVTVSAARGRLARLLENLFRNSVEHGSTSSRTESGDTIERGREDVRITVGPLPDGDGFYVDDDGPGIDPEQREAVFETGYTTNPDGTGFGLRIVSEISDAHGWSVELVESDGGGARFEFRGVEVVD